MGRINLIDVEVIEAGDQLVVRSQIGAIRCPCMGALSVGQKVKLGIRAESVRLCSAADALADNCFTATVKTAIFLGEHTECDVVINDVTFSMKFCPESPVAAGDQIRIELPTSCWGVLPDAEPGAEQNICTV